jgi:hypothetical protein
MLPQRVFHACAGRGIAPSLDEVTPTATASVNPSSLTVNPGAEAVAEVTVRNVGAIVEEFDITVLGESARWTEVVPPTVKLFPGDETQAQVFFRPPRLASTVPGPTAFGVSVRPRHPDALGVAEEGTVEVGSFTDTGAELLPRNSTGRLRGRHDLTLSNNGNGRVEAEVTAADADDLLRFMYSPGLLGLPAGTAGYSRIKAKPRKLLWWGQPRTIPFNVFVEPADGTPATTLDAGLVQLPIIPRWSPRALLALAALALAWLVLLKPTVEDTAAKAAVAEVGKPTPTPSATEEPKPPTQSKPGGGGGGSGGGKDEPKEPPKPTASDGRLEVGATADFTVPEGKTMAITDLVFENSSGREGVVQLKRNDDVLLTLDLATFRYLDYHFVTPIALGAGDKLELACEKGSCDGAAVYYSGGASKVADKKKAEKDT